MPANPTSRTTLEEMELIRQHYGEDYDRLAADVSAATIPPELQGIDWEDLLTTLMIDGRPMPEAFPSPDDHPELWEAERVAAYNELGDLLEGRGTAEGELEAFVAAGLSDIDRMFASTRELLEQFRAQAETNEDDPDGDLSFSWNNAEDLMDWISIFLFINPGFAMMLLHAFQTEPALRDLQMSLLEFREELTDELGVLSAEEIEFGGDDPELQWQANQEAQTKMNAINAIKSVLDLIDSMMQLTNEAATKGYEISSTISQQQGRTESVIIGNF